jgi:hypothetical protein
VLRRFSVENQSQDQPEERYETPSGDERARLKEALEALQRWDGEGGAPDDRFGVVDELYRRIMAESPRLHERASWPGWTSGSEGKLTPPPRVHNTEGRIHDLTEPGFPGYGFYLIKVPSVQYTQLIRASHATASRLAQSRTQYGSPSELHFLGAIETPALD